MQLTREREPGRELSFSLQVHDDGATLYENPFSWNKVANVLYLESPAGVGYSYSDDKNYGTDDDQVSPVISCPTPYAPENQCDMLSPFFQVAEDNYRALLSFFAKFPAFSHNDFFIFGESYGGIYVPTLSLRVATGPSTFNFKVRFPSWSRLFSYQQHDVIVFFCSMDTKEPYRIHFGIFVLHLGLYESSVS